MQRGRGTRHHDGLQPAERALADPAARAPARRPARRVGFRRPGDDRLVRRHRHEAVALGAGLDLEMPGPGASFRSRAGDAVKKGDVDEADLDAALQPPARWLRSDRRAGRARAVFGPASRRPPTSRCCAEPRPRRRCCCERRSLPLGPTAAGRVAVVGPPAVTPTIMGGGSAQLTPHPVVSPPVVAGRRVPTGRRHRLRARVRGDPISGRRRRPGAAGARRVSSRTAMPAWRSKARSKTDAPSAAPDDEDRLEPCEPGGRLVDAGQRDRRPGGDRRLPAGPRPGRARPALCQRRGRPGRLHQPAPRRAATISSDQASQDLVCRRPFREGVPVDLVVEYAFSDTSLAGFRVGFRTPDSDALLERAVAAAAEADVAIVCVGTSDGDRDGRARPHRPGVARTAGRVRPSCRRGQRPHRRGGERRRRRSTWNGRRTSPPCCSAGSAARRWPGRWPTCSSARPSPVGGCPRRFPCVSGTLPLARELPG